MLHDLAQITILLDFVVYMRCKHHNV